MIQLKPHQGQAVADMRAGVKMLLWEPGCGKTYPALEYALERFGRILYLCPASIRWQVADEAARLNEQMTIQVIQAGADAVDENADLVICSYDMAAGKYLWPRLFKLSWGTLILDEGHYLKNREAKRTRAVYGARASSPGALIRKAGQTIVLTGTPITKDPSDLWTHYSRLFPNAVTTVEGKPLRFREWVDLFCQVRHTAFGQQIVGGKNLDELRTLLAPYVSIKRLADVVDDMPALTIDHARIKGEAIDRGALPDDVRAALAAVLNAEDGDGLKALEVEPEFQPAVATLRRLIADAKAAAVAEYVRDEIASGVSKILVFGIHTDALKRIAAGLVNQEIPAFLFLGETPGSARRQRLADFQNAASAVLVGNIQALGTGLNLQTCHRIIFAEASWTPAENTQAIGRCYRTGQRLPVRATFLSLRGSIDDNVQRALTRKARIIEKVLA